MEGVGLSVVNILLEGYDIDAPWLYSTLKNYIKPHHSVAVVAFSFRELQSAEEWELAYGKGKGRYYSGIAGAFAAYGVPEDRITFFNYFTDSRESAAQKIAGADIVYFPGGLPDKMMERIREFELEDVLARHDGIVMGYSAGAVIQLAEYHLSPDKDYPDFGYYEGLAFLDGFYLEVHYEGSDIQDRAIQRVLAERGKPVYATVFQAGAILVDGGKLQLLGDVRVFD